MMVMIIIIITGIYSQFLPSKIPIIPIIQIIIIIIIIITFVVRHICACSSVTRQEAACRSVCNVAQYAFLIQTFDGRKWSTSRPGRKSPRYRNLLGPRDGLDAAEREKSLAFTGNKTALLWLCNT